MTGIEKRKNIRSDISESMNHTISDGNSIFKKSATTLFTYKRDL